MKNFRLSGLKLISPSLHRDARGFFFEAYQQPHFNSLGIGENFIQDNVSYSKQGTVRALHFQSEPGQAKLVTCLQGKIWDVAVDIRPASPTFGEWEAVLLDSEECCQLFIPVGFAHGFCVLSEQALVHYKTSSLYHPKTECAIRWNDPDLKIEWPVQRPILSSRDQTSPFFKEVFNGAMDHRR